MWGLNTEVRSKCKEEETSVCGYTNVFWVVLLSL